jgi:hypothetical protein
MNYLMLAEVGGGGVVKQLLYLLLVIVCCLIVWFLGKYAFQVFEAPPVFLKIWTFLFVLIAAIVLINFLLGLGGHPFLPTW